MTPCLSESAVPPEAVPIVTGDIVAALSNRSPRFTEDEAAEYAIWDPDSVSQARVVADESILLEERGVTSQNADARRQEKIRQLTPEFWKRQTVYKASIAAKLRQTGQFENAAKLELCHSYYTVCQCNNCHTVRKYPNRCDLFYCPECAAHLENERRKQVEWWVREVTQPKHVVLTVRNIPRLSRGHIDQLMKWFGNLRRRKFAANWRGGFWTIQCTNENAGWHLHIHALVDANWIDAPKLALEWDNVTNGMGRIVKVRDCREQEYLAEVTRYVVRGSQLAKWTPDEISSFISAFEGKRCFGVFGSLFAKRTQFAEWIAELKSCRPKCDCGSSDCSYYSEAEWLIRELGSPEQTRPRPPPVDQASLPLPECGCSWPD